MKKFKLDSIVGETNDGGMLELTFATNSFDSVADLRGFAKLVYMGDNLKSKKVKYSVIFEYVEDLSTDVVLANGK